MHVDYHSVGRSWEVLNIVVKPVIHKDENEEKAAFFSPKSFADGFFNNTVGVVGMAQGLVSDKVQDEFDTRLDKEARIAELAAAKGGRERITKTSVSEGLTIGPRELEFSF